MSSEDALAQKCHRQGNKLMEPRNLSRVSVRSRATGFSVRNEVDDWATFSPKQRAAAYRGLARSIERAADSAANAEAKASYLQLAKEWDALAEQLVPRHLQVEISVDPEIGVFLRLRDP
jgi:hypothetical protein